jgi:hypothetical protein
MNNRSNFGFVSPNVLFLLAMMLLPVLGFSQTSSRTATVQRMAIHEGKQGPEVEITSSEPIAAQIRMLNGPDRVVIDFPGALPGEQLRSIAVNSGGIKRVRVGLFEAAPPITRVVLDLTAPSNYQLFPSGDTVIVKIGDMPEAANAGSVPQLSAPDLVAPPAARAQGSSQNYTASADRVQLALQRLGGYSGGSLPMLEGFARPDVEQLERYERPYYRYRVEVKAIDATHTTVNVVASLNAWFNDPSTSHSGYRSLLSNGRLEEDLLDRLQNALQVQASTLAPGSATEQSPPPSPSVPPTVSSLALADIASNGATTEAAAAPESKDSQDQGLGYWVSQQEVRPFVGEWAQLKGKNALFVFAQPRGALSDMVPDQRKVLFLKSVFADSYQTAMHSPNPFQGVVVIFAGARGAVAAATLADIRQWMGGRMPDDVFIKRCSLDPPAEFPQPGHGKGGKHD